MTNKSHKTAFAQSYKSHFKGWIICLHGGLYSWPNQIEKFTFCPCCISQGITGHIVLFIYFPNPGSYPTPAYNGWFSVLPWAPLGYSITSQLSWGCPGHGTLNSPSLPWCFDPSSYLPWLQWSSLAQLPWYHVFTVLLLTKSAAFYTSHLRDQTMGATILHSRYTLFLFCLVQAISFLSTSLSRSYSAVFRLVNLNSIHSLEAI